MSEMIIKTIEIHETDDKARWTAFLEINTIEKELWFETPIEYKSGLCSDVCDAVVCTSLYYCLKNGINISSNVPMSSEIYFKITDILIPALLKADSRFKKISIKLPTIPTSILKHGKYTGTALSCGVDSLYSIINYSNISNSDFKVTHLCINNVGAFNGTYNVAKGGPKKVKEKAYERSRLVSNEIQLPLIETESNYEDVFKQEHSLSHTYSSMFPVLCMRSFWNSYLYPSSGHILNDFKIKNAMTIDSSSYEILILSCFSDSKITMISSGANLTRLEKVLAIKDCPIVQKYLYSCIKSESNCGFCEKCKRNLLTLDVLGVLNAFSEAFDLKLYDQNRESFITEMYENDSDLFLNDLKGYLRTHPNPFFEKLKARHDELTMAVNNYRNNNDIVHSVELFKNNISISPLARRYYADALIVGKGIEKNKDEAIKFLHSNTDSLSRYKLAIILLDGDDKQVKEGLSILINLATNGGAKSAYVLSCVYLDNAFEGKPISAGIKNLAEGRKWLEKAVKMGNVDAMFKYSKLILLEKDESRYKQAFDILSNMANNGGSRSQYELAQMYLHGLYTNKDKFKAIKLLRQSSAKGNVDAKYQLALLLFESDNNDDLVESEKLLMEIANNGGPRSQFKLSQLYLRKNNFDLIKSEKYLKASLECGDRINWFTSYIFYLRRTILSMTDYQEKEKTTCYYYRLLEEHGSWISIEAKFESEPIFPHGLLGIFISRYAKIGSNCTIFQHVTIGSNSMEGHQYNGGPTIGNSVYIGANATIIGNVTIGNNVNIGGGTTVVTDVPSDSTVVSAKSRVIVHKSA